VKKVRLKGDNWEKYCRWNPQRVSESEIMVIVEMMGLTVLTD